MPFGLITLAGFGGNGVDVCRPAISATMSISSISGCVSRPVFDAAAPDAIPARPFNATCAI